MKTFFYVSPFKESIFIPDQIVLFSNIQTKSVISLTIWILGTKKVSLLFRWFRVSGIWMLTVLEFGCLLYWNLDAYCTEIWMLTVFEGRWFAFFYLIWKWLCNKQTGSNLWIKINRNLLEFFLKFCLCPTRHKN